MSAAHVKNTKMTTAMVTSWELRKVKPSKYMATARLPSMADLRLHISLHLIRGGSVPSNGGNRHFAQDCLNHFTLLKTLDLMLGLEDDSVSNGQF